MRTHTHTHIRHHHVHLHCAVPHTSCMAHVFRITYKMDILAGAPPKKPFSNLFLLFLALSLSLIIFPLTHVCILSIDADIVSVLRYRYAVGCIEIMHQQHTPCCMGCTCTCTTSTWRFFFNTFLNTEHAIHNRLTNTFCHMGKKETPTVLWYIVCDNRRPLYNESEWYGTNVWLKDRAKGRERERRSADEYLNENNRASWIGEWKRRTECEQQQRGRRTEGEKERESEREYLKWNETCESHM